MSTVEGRGGVVDEWEGITSTSKGEYRLDDDSGADFGEPIVLGTGLTSTPSIKRSVASYTGVAGVLETFGVSLNIKEDISAWTAEDYALKGSHVRRRDITVLLIGACKVKSVESATTTEVNKTVIPADGGFELMTVNTQYSLGKSLQQIIAGEAGYIWINPGYEKDNIQT